MTALIGKFLYMRFFRLPAMLSSILFGLVCFCFVSFGNSAEKTEPSQQGQFFNENVAPILTKHCLECHHDDFSKAEFSLSTAESIRRGGESGAVIEAGDPDSSYLMLLITSEKTADSDVHQAEMP
ncbi:MAG: hypothetical protein JKY95_13145 [Planctomycetaceae bacterium]|nr:hypothetical protein [Planctomycetaceae bacterium]